MGKLHTNLKKGDRIYIRPPREAEIQLNINEIDPTQVNITIDAPRNVGIEIKKDSYTEVKND